MLLAGAFYYFFGGASTTHVFAAMDAQRLELADVSAAPTQTHALDTGESDEGESDEVVSNDTDERAVLAFLRSRHTGLARHDELNVARTVVAEARRNGFDPALVLAVIQVESGGYNLAVSHVGAMGLMQLLPATAEELANRLDLDWRGPDSLFDPVLNVKLGTTYLKHLSDRYGDMTTALAAYNWGPGRIDKRIRKGSGLPLIYTNRIMQARELAEARREALPTTQS
jgi:hypothetical protein